MAAPLARLLGPSLALHGEPVDTAALADSAKYVGLYFSAHWCPPCRMFTPQLAKFYKDALRAKGLEIVFVSSDKDEAAFKQYSEEQPWPALPFADRDRKAKLSAKFKVQGIPTLVILDARTGELITANGRAAVSNDPKGASMPWAPPNALDLLKKSTLVDHKRSTVAFDKIVGGAEVIGLYFSAHWCPPCKAFTPKFADTYAKLKEADAAAGRPQRFAVVFVSSDRDEPSFSHYLETMPWHAVNELGGEVTDQLSEMFGVEGIPTLVLLDAKGKLLTTEAVGAVAGDPEGAEFPWTPKPVNVLNQGTAGAIQGPSLMAFLDDDAGAKKLVGELSPLVKSWQTEGDSDFIEGSEDLTFFACGKDDLVERIRQICGGAGKEHLVILDLASGQCIVPSTPKEINTANIKTFVQDFVKGAYKGKGIPLVRS